MSVRHIGGEAHRRIGVAEILILEECEAHRRRRNIKYIAVTLIHMILTEWAAVCLWFITVPRDPGLYSVNVLCFCWSAVRAVCILCCARIWAHHDRVVYVACLVLIWSHVQATLSVLNCIFGVGICSAMFGIILCAYSCGTRTHIRVYYIFRWWKTSIQWSIR